MAPPKAVHFSSMAVTPAGTSAALTSFAGIVGATAVGSTLGVGAGDSVAGGVTPGDVEVGLGSGVSVAPESAVSLGLDVGCGVAPVVVGLGEGDPFVAEAGAMAPTASTATRAAEAHTRLTDLLINGIPQNHELKEKLWHRAGGTGPGPSQRALDFRSQSYPTATSSSGTFR